MSEYGPQSHRICTGSCPLKQVSLFLERVQYSSNVGFVQGWVHRVMAGSVRLYSNSRAEHRSDFRAIGRLHSSINQADLLRSAATTPSTQRWSKAERVGIWPAFLDSAPSRVSNLAMTLDVLRASTEVWNDVVFLKRARTTQRMRCCWFR